MKKLAPFCVLLAGMLWGTIGIFVRGLDAVQLSSMDIVLLRGVVTTVLLFVYLFLHNRRLLRIQKKDIWCFIGTGLCSVVFFNYCYFKTITIASLSIAAVLLYTAPAMVMLMSAVLFHEKITRRRLGSLVATFVGCMLVTGVLGEQEGLTVGSICVGLGAGLGYALYSIFGRYALERGYEPITISFYTFLLAAVGTLPFSNGWAVVKAVTSEASVLGLSLLFGLFTTVIPYIVYTAGLKELETSRAAILASIEPVTATLFGVFLYQEGLSFSELLGIILVLSGIVISNIEKKSKA